MFCLIALFLFIVVLFLTVFDRMNFWSRAKRAIWLTDMFEFLVVVFVNATRRKNRGKKGALFLWNTYFGLMSIFWSAWWDVDMSIFSSWYSLFCFLILVLFCFKAFLRHMSSPISSVGFVNLLFGDEFNQQNLKK